MKTLSTVWSLSLDWNQYCQNFVMTFWLCQNTLLRHVESLLTCRDFWPRLLLRLVKTFETYNFYETCQYLQDLSWLWGILWLVIILEIAKTRIEPYQDFGLPQHAKTNPQSRSWAQVSTASRPTMHSWKKKKKIKNYLKSILLKK